MFLWICLSVYLFVLSVCLSDCFPAVCLSVHLSVCPSVCLSISLSVRLFVCPSVRLSVYPSLLWGVLGRKYVLNQHFLVIFTSTSPLARRYTRRLFKGRPKKWSKEKNEAEDKNWLPFSAERLEGSLILIGIQLHTLTTWLPIHIALSGLFMELYIYLTCFVGMMWIYDQENSFGFSYLSFKKTILFD